jgi:hypothetical protein
VTGLGERLEDDWDAAVTKVRELTGYPEPVPPIQAIPTSQENHVSIGTEFHRIATVLETFGEDGIAIFEAIAGNPETRDGAVMLARMAGLPLTPGLITTAMGGLAVAENIWHAGQQAVQHPAAQTAAVPPPAQVM